MASTTFGASIVPSPATANNASPQIPMLDSPALTPAASREGLDEEYSEQRHVPSHSPFYNNQVPAQLAPAHSRQNSKEHALVVNEKDLEAGVATPLSSAQDDNPFTSKVSVDCNKECNMWPSKQTLMQKKLAEKKKRRDGKFCRGCGPVVEFWGRLSKKQRLLVQLGIALFVVGAAVAIGVGISVAVHGTYFSGHGQKHIPQSR